ncbi:cell division protein FtsH, partial [Candidatus Bathyarchaeota archaeon]|nr:cell division protein FtsH [Candidatus Bathyarchaeota archaeon]
TEELKSDDITTGSQNDLERATQIARKMVTEFGMSERLGPVRLGRKQHEIFLGRDIVEDRNYSEEIAYAIDQEVRRIIDDCYELVRDLLVKHDSVLEKIAEVLLEKEVLEGEELDSLINEKLDEVTNRSEGDADAESVAAAQAVEKKTSLQLEPRIDPA